MKELLSFLKLKTQTLAGQKFDAPEMTGNGSLLAQFPLDMLANGFHAVGDDDLVHLVKSFDSLKMTERVVACEGAFTAAICLDISKPLDFSRADQLANLAPTHIAGLGLGVGHALSTLGVAADISPSIAENYLGWLALDAYGMHEGYFRWFDSVHNMRVPKGLSPLAQEAFDQGLGRGLWFIAECDAETISNLVGRFPVTRRSSLWRGIGLMTGFWGAEDEKEIKRLLRFSGPFRAFFQQGIAQAVHMRFEMDEIVDHTDAACEIALGASTEEMATFASELIQTIPGSPADSRTMHRWQNEIVEFFSQGSQRESQLLTLFGARRSAG